MPKIELKNVYKIFGEDPQSVLPLVKKGATKKKYWQKPIIRLVLITFLSVLKKVKLSFVWVCPVQGNQHLSGT
jgi:hypothetical protein